MKKDNIMRTQINEDSNTLDYFVKTSKKEKLQKKKTRKEIEKRERKDSTQLSIFSWLVKDKPKQNCLILSLDKFLLIEIFRFLRISQIVKLSTICTYFYDCSKSIWNDRHFFSQLETDKFTNKQLKKVIEKSSRLSHIRQLKSIYLGKNLGSCRQKIKLRISQGIPLPGILLEIFEISSKNNRNSFLTDANLEDIVNSSFQSLKVVTLNGCTFLKKLSILSRCIDLTHLSIISNNQFCSQDLAKICKRCENIEGLSLIECRNLDENIFKSISQLEKLQKFQLRGYKQTFRNISFLETNSRLKFINLQNSLILDCEIIELVKICTNIVCLNIDGCELLTDQFLEGLTKLNINIKQLHIHRTHFSMEILNKIKKIFPFMQIFGILIKSQNLPNNSPSFQS